MHWIALQLSPSDDPQAWAWHALQFTPRVAWVEEALLLEVSASEALFGGRKLLRQGLLRAPLPPSPGRAWADATISLVALALLRLKKEGVAIPKPVPDALPLHTLSAARPHLHTLDRIGCTTWGQLKALPRAGLSRRFGAELLQAMDALAGQRAERYEWVRCPEAFDVKVELMQQATSAPEMLWPAQRLLSMLQLWLQARNQGLLALELEWTLGLRRMDGKPLPPTETLQVRTGEPTQDMVHLRRLVSEHMDRTRIAAPVTDLRMRSLETVPWGGKTVSLLPQDHRPGDRLHQFIERVSVRLGEESITCPVDVEDHRPEVMQGWKPARTSVKDRKPPRAPASDELLPGWLLREPLALDVKADKPCYQGPLQLLTRARRLEAGWWDTRTDGPAVRDYFIARSEQAGLLWIYRERLSVEQDQARWYLHGLYA